MTNPKPDRVYSIDPKKYIFPPYFKISAKLDRYLQIMEGINHPFFILEGKSASGPLMNTENAASRGEAGLTRSILGMDTTTLGPDWDICVFSATLNPKVIYIWVNWAEVKGEDDGETIYHMSKVKQHFLDDQ
ncbi:MAG: hypothetical protein Q9206_004496 [Seirophora lacunosa]